MRQREDREGEREGGGEGEREHMQYQQFYESSFSRTYPKSLIYMA